MKCLLLLSLLLGNVLLISAQNSTGTTKSRANAKKSSAHQRGSGQYHGSKDTTPGSPMGTGGAGGNEMSGSPAGSASETAIQAGKAEDQKNDQTVSEGFKAKKANAKKKGLTRKSRNM